MGLEFDRGAFNLDHIAQHLVTAAEVEYVLEHTTLDIEYQDWHEEERFAEVGKTQTGRILLVISTWRGLQIRVVTAYDGPKLLAEQYLGKQANLGAIERYQHSRTKRKRPASGLTTGMSLRPS